MADEGEEKNISGEWSASLDALADFEARVSRCETFETALSRRLTALEESGRGHMNDDPFAGMMPLVWVMLALTVAPLVIDLIKQLRADGV